MSSRYFYHSFPRPRDGETYSQTVQRGWAILRSIRQLGFILAPEIVEWRTPVSIGFKTHPQILQQRVCFTELSREELQEHSKRFGPFAIEFDIVALRRAGALPVIYMPQALSKEDHLTLIGPFVVKQLDAIKHVLGSLNTLNQFTDPDYIKKNYSGAKLIADDCMATLTNPDESGVTVQEFQVSWNSIRDLLSFLTFENPPFAAMTGAISIAQSLFYPTDDDHVDERLGYYRQREWRITAGFSINESPRGRILGEDEKQSLIDLDKRFWKGELLYEKQTCHRIDKTLALSRPDADELFGIATRVVVPGEKIHQARQLLGDLSIKVDRLK